MEGSVLALIRRALVNTQTRGSVLNKEKEPKRKTIKGALASICPTQCTGKPFVVHFAQNQMYLASKHQIISAESPNLPIAPSF